MNVRQTAIEGLLTIEPDVYHDGRGYFLEQYSVRRYGDIEAPGPFVQDNCSCSRYGTVRGLHYQIGDYAQGKLVYVPYGRVLDVAVDIRFGSPTFGRHVALELNSAHGLQMWLPPGLAHGFSVLSETAVFMYKCTAYYSREHERAIRYDDPDLAIDWQVTNPVVSEKDLAAPSLRAIEKDFVFPC
jgi:dTDP-4-dehydrorhamnose 3,5-epimerase